MAYSDVSISNIALSLLGADAIRDFDENNKRARMCSNVFEPTKNTILSKFDWPFARKYAELTKLDLTDLPIPFGSYGFQLPNNCITPRDIAPLGSRDHWEIMGSVLYTNKSEVGLYYTAQITSPSSFSDAFVSLLSLAISIKIGPPITQDKKLVSELKAQYISERNEVFESEANIGNDYREYDNDPDNDSFVNPDISEATDKTSSRV